LARKNTAPISPIKVGAAERKRPPDLRARPWNQSWPWRKARLPATRLDVNNGLLRTSPQKKFVDLYLGCDALEPLGRLPSAAFSYFKMGFSNPANLIPA
jgi:hypothetical protein